jgi:hypothetical protein
MFAYRPNVVENPKLAASRIIWWQFHPGSWPELLWHLHAINESFHLRFFDLLKPFQITQLRLKLIVCTIEPVPFPHSTMNAERSPDRIPKFIRPEFVLAGKDLNSFGQSCSPP